MSTELYRHRMQRSAAKTSRGGSWQVGFTLLEVLVAVVVLSFGLLGVVGLQAASLQANRDARLQSSAVRLARELADMMRDNHLVALQNTTASNPYLVPNFTGTGTLPAAPENCFTLSVTTGCTSTINVAAFQAREWLSRVAEELPGARVVVCFDSDPYTAAGLPQWRCTAGGGVLVVKIGWTRLSTKRDAAASAALDQATVPTVVLPLIPGA